jgi:hypothetical protein
VELRTLLAKSELSAYHGAAETLLRNYRPLVEMQVLKPDGTLVGRQSMNEDILKPFDFKAEGNPELNKHFQTFLSDAYDKARKSE